MSENTWDWMRERGIEHPDADRVQRGIDRIDRAELKAEDARKGYACPECGDGDSEWATLKGSCTFGCGYTVDTDTGMCPHCKEHSANRAECNTCGTALESWSGKWEKAQ